MHVKSIAQLDAVDSLEKLEALNTLGIYSIADMAQYAPCRHADFVIASFNNGNAEGAGLEHYLEPEALTPANLAQLGSVSMALLTRFSEADATVLQTAFGLSTLGELAQFAPYTQAQAIVLRDIRGEFYEKPSAPPALIPKLIGSTHTQVRFSNYVKEREYLLDDHELTTFTDSDEPSAPNELLAIFHRGRCKFFLGYLASIHQKWIDHGTSLGAVVHSLALAPGESRNVAVLDWYRRQRTSRDESTTASETLHTDFTQTRALNEVVRTTANEHLYGQTDVDSTTRTSGGGLVGGRAAAGSSGGSAAGNLAAFGLPVSVGGSALGSVSNSIGASLVFSNGSVQGTLQSETTGERAVMGEVVQNIADATVQNSSNVRSVMSTVVVEDEQRGRQRGQTRNVTNYNHSHALNVEFFELLQSYRTDTVVDRLMPVLFLPFGPIAFNIELIKSYWYLFGKAIKRVLPGRFFEFDQVVKNFNPENDAFDASSDLRVERVKIKCSRTFSEPIRVKLTDSEPSVTLAISGFDLDDSLNLKLTGSNTYVSYDVLDTPNFDASEFGSVDSFEIDEGIKASVASDFTAELKEAMKQYLDDEHKTPKVADTNRDDNELGLGSNREALKEDVDENLFSIQNNTATLDMTLDIEYTVADRNGQEQVILQTLHRTYTYAQLAGEIGEELADVSAHINEQLANVADINPADVIAEIEQHFDFYKYGYTKYLLANAEKEQITDIIENLGIHSSSETLALSALIDPSPIAMTDNLLVFKLKEDDAGGRQQLWQNYFGTMRSALIGGGSSVLRGRGVRQRIVRNGRSCWKYRFWAEPDAKPAAVGHITTDITFYIDATANNGGRHPVEGTVIVIQTSAGKKHRALLKLRGLARSAEGSAIGIDYQITGSTLGTIDNGEQGTIDWTFDFPQPSEEDVTTIVTDYGREIDEYEGIVKQRHRRDTVFLPTSGVFAEAILGLANGSEFINPRRFFQWTDAPIPNLAPSLQALNVNQDYAQPASTAVNPTMPVSVLNQITPQTYAMPTSLTTAMQTLGNGTLFTDMSKTAELTSILGSLAELANNTAQLSGNLAGEAASSALNNALALGQQVASMVGTAMNTNVADPPQSLTSQGAALEVLDEIAANGVPATPTDQAAAGAMGTPLPSTPEAEETMDESLRKYIYAGADLTAQRRAFDPLLRSPSGVTTFSVLVPDLPNGGSIRWSVPPTAAGRYTLKNQKTVQVGQSVEVTALIPGKTQIDVEARDARGRVLESLKLDLCIPQFFSVVRDPAFDALLATYGLVPDEIVEVTRVAKVAADIALSSANVRVIWPGEVVPPHMPVANVSTITLFGNHPNKVGVAGSTPGNAGPLTFADAISIWVGAFDDPIPAGPPSGDIDDVTREVVATMLAEGMTSSAEKTLAIEILGRLLGSTIAHEIVHSLIGATLSGGAHNAVPVSGDLMNAGFATTFQEKTGYDVLGPLGSAPLSTLLFDNSMFQMCVPGADAQTRLNLDFPVPPVFE